MIVLVNPSNKTVTICDKTVKVYPWHKIQELRDILSGQDVLYVTSAVETTGEDVLDVISSSYSDEDIGDQTHPDTEFYIYCTKGILITAYNGKEYTFNSRDFLPVWSLPEGILDKCKTVADALKSGLLVIVGESERDYLIQEKQEKTAAAKNRGRREEELGSVDNPIPIEISSTGNFRKGD